MMSQSPGGVSTCLAIGKDADVVAIKSRGDQLSDIVEDLLLCALWPKDSVKLKGLHDRGAAIMGCLAGQSCPCPPKCCKTRGQDVETRECQAHTSGDCRGSISYGRIQS